MPTMTTDISTMTDEELDRAIAIEVFGWTPNENDEDEFLDDNGKAVMWLSSGLWYPSHKISDAWRVVERMRKEHHWTMILDNKTSNPDHYSVILQHVRYDGRELISVVDFKPAPRAICEAALTAVRSTHA